MSKKTIAVSLAIVILGLASYFGYQAVNNQPKQKMVNLSIGKLTVISPSSPSLNAHVLSADTPPSTASTTLQSSASSLNQSSKQPLQTNVNLNDPNLANNSLISSLKSINP